MSRRALLAGARRRGAATGGSAVVFPADANIVNVKNAPYNAVGDGVADDTAALLNAFTDAMWLDASSSNIHPARSCSRTVYLPAGTYKVTSSLTIPGCSVRIIGSGESTTTIKLANNATGFGNAASPAYLLRTGQAGGTGGQENAGFANYIDYLTLDVGSGNPGAVGCRYSVANCGSMRHVTIKSSDPAKAGYAGLWFGTTAGPGYVADVTIDGFQIGIYTESNLANDLVLSGMVLKNQTVEGVQHNAKSLAFENLTVTNTPLAVEITDPSAAITLAGGTFTAASGTSGPAIKLVASSYLWCRDVSATGFGNIVTQGATVRFSGQTSLVEWAASNYREGNTSKAWTGIDYVSLNLPVKRAPEYTSNNLTQWASVVSFGAVTNSTQDLGVPLQRAIDSGAKVVYVPWGSYTLSTPVTMRGACRKIDFMFSLVNLAATGAINVGDTTDGVANVENLITAAGLGVVHNSTGTVAFRDFGTQNGYTSVALSTGTLATGDLYYESAGANQHVIINRPINVWLRQINRERGVCNISGGATVWILGDNIELHSTYIDADFIASGGSLEILGGTFDELDYSGYPSSGKAAYAGTDTQMAIVMPSALRSSTSTPSTIGHWVSDTKSGVSVGDVLGTDAYVASSTTAASRVVIPMYRSPRAAPTVSQVQSGLNSGPALTSLTVTLAASPTAGNLLTMSIYTDSVSGLTVPNGFSQAAQSSGTTTGMATILYRIADGTEGTTFTVTTPASSWIDIQMREWSAGTPWPTTPLDAVGATTSISGSVTTATVTASGATSVANTFAIAALGVGGTTSAFTNTWTGGFTGLGASSRFDVATKQSAAIETFSTAEGWTTARQFRWALASFRIPLT